MTEEGRTINLLAFFVFGDVMKAPRDFNPLQDWNHWRQVEEKIMEDEKLWWDFMEPFNVSGYEIWHYMKADLPTRCSALLSILHDE